MGRRVSLGPEQERDSSVCGRDRPAERPQDEVGVCGTAVGLGFREEEKVYYAPGCQYVVIRKYSSPSQATTSCVREHVTLESSTNNGFIVFVQCSVVVAVYVMT